MAVSVWDPSDEETAMSRPGYSGTKKISPVDGHVHEVTRTAQRSIAQHSAAQRSTAQHSAAQRSTAQHSRAQRTQCDISFPGALPLGPRLEPHTPASSPWPSFALLRAPSHSLQSYPAAKRAKWLALSGAVTLCFLGAVVVAIGAVGRLEDRVLTSSDVLNRVTDATPEGSVARQVLT